MTFTASRCTSPHRIMASPRPAGAAGARFRRWCCRSRIAFDDRGSHQLKACPIRGPSTRCDEPSDLRRDAARRLQRNRHDARTSNAGLVFRAPGRLSVRSEVRQVVAGDTRPLRMHYLDEGDPAGQPVVLLRQSDVELPVPHDDPTVGGSRSPGSGAGSLIGMGRSDKPAQLSDYTYLRHVEWVTLDLMNSTCAT